MRSIPLPALLLPLCIAACEENPASAPANQPPTAYAGRDATVFDRDADGMALVALDGSRSRDPDGFIARYIWAENGNTLATTAAPEVILPLGAHGITLLVEDDAGEEATDLVWIAVRPAPVPNRPPVATILSPRDGTEYWLDDYVVLRGLGVDPDESQIDGSWLVWSCEHGRIGVGKRVMHSFEAGEHRIELRVRDFEGLRGTASITIFVRVSFADDVLPYFLDHCATCHGSRRAEGEIRLHGYEAITTGGNEHGTLVVAGDPARGILIPKLLGEHYDVGGWGLDYDAWFVDQILAPWIVDGLPDN